MLQAAATLLEIKMPRCPLIQHKGCAIGQLEAGVPAYRVAASFETLGVLEDLSSSSCKLQTQGVTVLHGCCRAFYISVDPNGIRADP